MNIDKMREDFEVWHARNCSLVCAHAGSEYKAWVASRESLVINLPNPDSHTSIKTAIEACAEAVERSGIRVAP